ncbi:DUF6095 family protein [Lutimonas sp.]|uniref:DUF6095 family protein n=1 Tax=Lutimonas sp. TaxID=1872403 RepID=UPI003D9AFA18
MNKNTDKKRREAIFENDETKNVFKNGMKYLAIALPLLFASPIVVTIGFKMINKGNGYFVLILGCLMTLITIIIVTQAFRLILKSLFNK